MEINDSIDSWCKQQNKTNGSITAFFWLIGGAGVTGFLAYAFDFPPLYIWSGASCLFWLLATTKPINIQRYLNAAREYPPGPSVPDSLLSHLADDNNVPSWVKCDLAERLENDPAGRITFKDLFELDSAILADSTRQRASTADGFKKLNAYRKG